MCGILGIIDKNRKFGINSNLLKEMTDALVHRGPDDEGFFIDETVGIGFRRLAIIDLNAGAQPIFNEDKSLVLVCNGEIYNYKELRKLLIGKGHSFRSECDVEVLVHLYEEYGFDCLAMLNGQFAFAIYDVRKKSIFIARDHVGIAPLFYTFKDGVLLFASEIKAILKHPSVERRINMTGLDQILSLPGLISPTTIFKDIHSLKPGHYIHFDGERMQVKEYWDLDYPREESASYGLSEKQYQEELMQTLQQAVRYRINADVPVGFYLSGGLDSSLVGAMIKQLGTSSHMNSFSIVFNDASIDERKYQQVMSTSLNSKHNEIFFDKSEIASRLRAAVYHAESPLKESYNTCSLALSENVRKNNIKVILSGEGADELFGGYVGYKFDKMRAEQGNYETEYEELMDQEIRGRLWGDPDFFYEKNFYNFIEFKRSIFSDHFNNCLDDFDCLNQNLVNKDRLDGRNILHKRSYLDFKLRISDHLVADHGDRVTYANSIEARYPFLDINVIEMVKGIPPHLKLNGLEEKYILKKCAEQLLPAQILKREKFSFVAPGSQFLLDKGPEWINDILSYETIKSQGYFNPDTVERIKGVYRSKNFSLNQTFENDILMIILTFGILLDLFEIKNL